MTKKYETPFTNVIGKKIDDLPDHVLQNINDLCTLLLATALVDKDKQRDPNIALAAMQKSLALLIAQFFPEEKTLEIALKVGSAMIDNAVEWSKRDMTNDKD